MYTYILSLLNGCIYQKCLLRKLFHPFTLWLWLSLSTTKNTQARSIREPGVERGRVCEAAGRAGVRLARHEVLNTTQPDPLEQFDEFGTKRYKQVRRYVPVLVPFF